MKLLKRNKSYMKHLNSKRVHTQIFKRDSCKNFGNMFFQSFS